MSQTLRAFLAIGLATIPVALLSAPKNQAIAVTTTVYDYNGATQLLMRSDDYNGSGFATYANASTKGKTQTSVSSQIAADGTWEMYFGPARTLWVTPNQPIGSQPPPTAPLPTAGLYGGHTRSICRTPDGALMPFTSLGTGITYSCQLGVEFHYGNPDLVYKLAMGPALPWGGPATGIAGVVCNSVQNNKCAAWTITSAPDENGENANAANLYYYTNGGWVLLGQYYNSFRIVVTNP